MASLAALAAYDVSDGDTDAEHSEAGGSPHDNDVTDGIHDDDDDAEEEAGEEEMETTVVEVDATAVKISKKRYSCENATALAVKLRTLEEDEIHLPSEPDGTCSAKLQQKITNHYEKKIKEGKDLNRAIQSRKDFRNPSIYEKLIAYLGIEELGSNFPKEEFDPEVWKKMPSYDELARLQREDIAKKDKKTKVEIVTAVKHSSTGGTSEPVKRTKWDKVSNDSKGPNSNSSKTTVISAVGSLKKSKS